MGTRTGFSEALVTHNHPGLSFLKELVSKLHHLPPTKKLIYLKQVGKNDIKLFIEIVYNFIRGNIITNQRSYKNLKKHKKLLYKFIAKGTSLIEKKKF